MVRLALVELPSLAKAALKTYSILVEDAWQEFLLRPAKTIVGEVSTSGQANALDTLTCGAFSNTLYSWRRFSSNSKIEATLPHLFEYGHQ